MDNSIASVFIICEKYVIYILVNKSSYFAIFYMMW